MQTCFIQEAVDIMVKMSMVGKVTSSLRLLEYWAPSKQFKNASNLSRLLPMKKIDITKSIFQCLFYFHAGNHSNYTTVLQF